MTVASNIILPKIILTRICADGTAIPKGTLMKLSGTNIAIAGVGSGEAFGGITVEEKVASDGMVTVGCAMDGVWDIVNSSAATDASGSIVCMSGANMFRKCVAGDLLTGAEMGKLEALGVASSATRVRLIGV